MLLIETIHSLVRIDAKRTARKRGGRAYAPRCDQMV